VKHHILENLYGIKSTGALSHFQNIILTNHIIHKKCHSKKVIFTSYDWYYLYESTCMYNIEHPYGIM